MVKGGLRNVDTLSFLSSTLLEETLTNLTAWLFFFLLLYTFHPHPSKRVMLVKSTSLKHYQLQFGWTNQMLQIDDLHICKLGHVSENPFALKQSALFKLMLLYLLFFLKKIQFLHPNLVIITSDVVICIRVLKPSVQGKSKELNFTAVNSKPRISLGQRPILRGTSQWVKIETKNHAILFEGKFLHLFGFWTRHFGLHVCCLDSRLRQ